MIAWEIEVVKMAQNIYWKFLPPPATRWFLHVDGFIHLEFQPNSEEAEKVIKWAEELAVTFRGLKEIRWTNEPELMAAETIPSPSFSAEQEHAQEILKSLDTAP